MRDHLRLRGRLAAVLVTVLAGIPGGATAAPTNSKAAEIVARLAKPGAPLEPLLAALSSGTISADVAPLRPGQLEPDPVEKGYAIEGSALAGFEVTNTPEGQAEIAAYLHRLEDLGEQPQAAGLIRVFSLPFISGTDRIGPLVGDPDPGDIDPGAPPTVDPDFLDSITTDVEPRDFLPDTSAVESVLHDGQGPLASALVLPGCSPLPALVGAVELPDTGIYVQMAFSSGVDTNNIGCNGPTPIGPSAADGIIANATGGEGPSPSNSDEWAPRGGLGCPYHRSNNTAWYLPCSYWYHREKDGNPDRDTFGLVQYGTGKGKGVWQLTELEVESWRKAGTPDQDWVDWGPKADSDYGHCQTDTAGVQVHGAYLERSVTHCEQWNITLKPGEPGGFANRWQGRVRRSERDTAMVIATNVPNGYGPTDYVDFDYYAM